MRPEGWPPDTGVTDADRIFAEAVRALEGKGSPIDLPRAPDLFRQAAEAGRSDAAVIHVNLVANGTGGAADWQRGLADLEGLAVHGPLCRREVGLLSAMALTWAGDPVAVPEPEQLSPTPLVARIRQLFTPDECAFPCEASASDPALSAGAGVSSPP
ncbi:MAG: hypothetical protein SNJ79_13990 [Sphingomonadaceae bacterium]